MVPLVVPEVLMPVVVVPAVVVPEVLMPVVVPAVVPEVLMSLVLPAVVPEVLMPPVLPISPEPLVLPDVLMLPLPDPSIVEVLVESMLMLDSLPESIPPSSVVVVVLVVLLSQAPSDAAPSASATINKEGFLVNIMVKEKLVCVAIRPVPLEQTRKKRVFSML